MEDLALLPQPWSQEGAGILLTQDKLSNREYLSLRLARPTRSRNHSRSRNSSQWPLDP